MKLFLSSRPRLLAGLGKKYRCFQNSGEKKIKIKSKPQATAQDSSYSVKHAGDQRANQKNPQTFLGAQKETDINTSKQTSHNNGGNRGSPSHRNRKGKGWQQWISLL